MIHSSFNEGFCQFLEYHLGETFELSHQEDIKGYWCDGVSWSPMPESQLTKQSVKETRKIETKAWIGKTGQDEYKLIIHFGNSALKNYAKGTSLVNCVPSSNSMGWIKINPLKRTLEIWLN